MVKYFRLTSSESQYTEFVFGTDSFLININYNEDDQRFYMDVYKNNTLVLKSLKLVWCKNNLFSNVKYKNLGELSIVSKAFDILPNGTRVLQELTKDNVTEFVFRWSYNE